MSLYHQMVMIPNVLCPASLRNDNDNKSSGAAKTDTTRALCLGPAAALILIYVRGASKLERDDGISFATPITKIFFVLSEPGGQWKRVAFGSLSLSTQNPNLTPNPKYSCGGAMTKIRAARQPWNDFGLSPAVPPT